MNGVSMLGLCLYRPCSGIECNNDKSRQLNQGYYIVLGIF